MRQDFEYYKKIKQFTQVTKQVGESLLNQSLKEQKLKSLYGELGKYYFQACERERDFSELNERTQAIREQIKALKSDIEKVKKNRGGITF